jgi:hypothetical protein
MEDKYIFVGFGSIEIGKRCDECFEYIGFHKDCWYCISQGREKKLDIKEDLQNLIERLDAIEDKSCFTPQPIIYPTPEDKAPSIATNPYIELLKAEIDYLKKKIAYLENK